MGAGRNQVGVVRWLAMLQKIQASHLLSVSCVSPKSSPCFGAVPSLHLELELSLLWQATAVFVLG